MRALLACLLAAALAGCLGSSAPPSNPNPSPSVVPPGGTQPGGDASGAGMPGPSAATLRLADCDTVHFFFAAPASGFAGYLPRGFTLIPSDPVGATVDLSLGVSVCGNAYLERDGGAQPLPGYGEAWVLLSVQPPEALRDSNVTADLIPVEAILSNADAVAQVAAWGLADIVAQGEVGLDSMVAAGGVEVSDARASAAVGTYDMHAVLRPMEGTDGPFAFRIWVPDGDGGVRGALRLDWGPWQNLGVGEATFASEGDPAAPPLHAGAAHHVAADAGWVTFAPSP
jgi:hypothetical protein